MPPVRNKPKNERREKEKAKKTRVIANDRLPAAATITKTASQPYKPMPVQRKRGTHDILKVGTMVKKRWRVEKKLGEGGCGTVYQVSDKASATSTSSSLTSTDTTTDMSYSDTLPSDSPSPGDGQYAMKVEKNRPHKDGVLKLEVMVTRRLRGRQHSCQLIDCGKKPDYTWMVITLVGPSLSDLRIKTDEHKRKKKSFFTASTTIRIGIQTLQAIQDVHEVGFIHRDIKPSNFAIGTGTRVIIYILDFGLARQYRRDGDEEIRPPRRKCCFRGTYRYCAPTAHERKEQCRRDDLFSWLYMLIEIHKGLPWNNISSKDTMVEMKKTLAPSQLLRGFPTECITVLEHIRSLDYDDTPDYRLIDDQLKRVMQQNGYDASDPYDWQSSVDNHKGDQLLQAAGQRSPNTTTLPPLTIDIASQHHQQ